MFLSRRSLVPGTHSCSFLVPGTMLSHLGLFVLISCLAGSGSSMQGQTRPLRSRKNEPEPQLHITRNCSYCFPTIPLYNLAEVPATLRQALALGSETPSLQVIGTSINFPSHCTCLRSLAFVAAGSQTCVWFQVETIPPVGGVDTSLGWMSISLKISAEKSSSQSSTGNLHSSYYQQEIKTVDNMGLKHAPKSISMQQNLCWQCVWRRGWRD